MTYMQFHFVFILPVIALLLLLLRKSLLRRWRSLVAGLGFLIFMALTYTTPWDNYLVYKGVWNYPADRVLFTIGYVPIEEYLFFVFMTILTGLWTFWLHEREPLKVQRREPTPRWWGAILSLGVAVALTPWLFRDHTLYLALILVWAMPVIALHWGYGGDFLWARRGLWLKAVLVPSVYLCATDYLAIDMGIWSISDLYTTGIHIFGLPMEEALFFTIANVLVVQGVLVYWVTEENPQIAIPTWCRWMFPRAA